MNNLEESRDSDTITISGYGDLCRMVGENTSDINILKESSEVVGELKMEMATMRLGLEAQGETLNELKISDKSILSGVTKFRYSLYPLAVLIFGCIIGTLIFGLKASRSDQNYLKEYLEVKIQYISDAQKKDSKVLNDKLDMQREDSKAMNEKLDKLIKVMIQHNK